MIVTRGMGGTSIVTRGYLESGILGRIREKIIMFYLAIKRTVLFKLEV